MRHDTTHKTVSKSGSGGVSHKRSFLVHSSSLFTTHPPSRIFIQHPYILWSDASLRRVTKPALRSGTRILFTFLDISFREDPSSRQFGNRGNLRSRRVVTTLWVVSLLLALTPPEITDINQSNVGASSLRSAARRANLSRGGDAKPRAS